jgi:ABC-type transporter Mla maintaining outer membrane lipid asymmetry ATPase subunit MlaF
MSGEVRKTGDLAVLLNVAVALAQYTNGSTDALKEAGIPNNLVGAAVEQAKKFPTKLGGPQ